MAAYAQFGYGYPSANQLLGGGGGSGGGVDGGVVVGQSTTASGIPQTSVATATAPSPLSGVNEASLSPSGCSTTTGVTTGPLSPGAISQTSNNAGTGASAVVDGGGAVAAASIVGDGSAAVASAGGTSCCENGRPIVTDPVSGQTVCSCQYDSARLALSSYSRMPAGSVGVYGTPYPSTEQNPYPSIGVDSSAFYSPLGNPYGLKDSPAGTEMTAWTSAGLQPTTGYYSYDPTLAAYGYGAGYDLAARRKNATRESTATLKAWLNEHKKNPYPTKGEKIMLAIITKMTLTQVSTWFANARRRLKKENKMTWEPKNKTEDDDDAMLSDDEKDGKDIHESDKSEAIYGAGPMDGDNRKDSQHIKSDNDKNDKTNDSTDDDHKPENLAAMRSLSAYNSAYIHPGYNPYQQQQHHPSFYQHGDGFGANESNEYEASKNQLSRDCGIPIPATKPKIWSLADTVACKTPPPTSYLGQQYYSQQQSLHHPQSQQQQMSHISNSSSSGSSNMPEHLTPMEQQPLRPQQPNTAAALNSPLSMMNSYVAGSPYSRIPTGYGTNAFSSSNSNSSTGMPTTPTSPPSMNAHQQPPQIHHHHLHHQHQHQLQQYQAQHQQLQQQRMGFSEIQPDTPPQTPPNMKHSSANGSAVNSLQVGPTTAPMTGMCYASSSSSLNRSYSHEMPAGNHVSSNYVGIMATSRTEG